MTDEQIIKALEVHSNEKFDNCEGCPYLVGDFCEGFTKHSKPFRDVIDLINRQQAEIERLEQILDKRCDVCPAVTTAIMSFAEKLKEKATSTFFEERKYVDTEDIDEIAEELTEPTKIEHNSLCETETYESR